MHDNGILPDNASGLRSIRFSLGLQNTVQQHSITSLSDFYQTCINDYVWMDDRERGKLAKEFRPPLAGI